MIDKQIRTIFKAKNSIVWQGIDGNNVYGYYYAEERIYLVRNMITDMISIVSARSPKEAFEKVELDHLKSVN